jgi:hypothetical protein
MIVKMFYNPEDAIKAESINPFLCKIINKEKANLK